MKYVTVLLIAGMILGGCASSKVVLLDGKKTGTALVVATKAGEQILDTPNTYTELSSLDAKPSPSKKLSTNEIKEKYGTLILAAPKPPVSYLLYFHAGSTELLEASRSQLPSIEKAIKSRVPCDVNIIGHADREGSKEYNIKLSLQRAKSVQQWLLQKELDVDLISVESYGEEDLLVPTKDGVSEPRNRRVEVLVR